MYMLKKCGRVAVGGVLAIAISSAAAVRCVSRAFNFCSVSNRPALYSASVGSSSDPVNNAPSMEDNDCPLCLPTERVEAMAVVALTQVTQ